MKRLDELVERYGLPAPARRQLGLLLRELAQKHAPTAVRDPVQAVDVHVADSLVALELAEMREAATLADIGAGAGLPSLVLAVALPGTRVYAVESATKKSAFIAETAQVMGLENVEVVASRVEEWRPEPVDVVTARALAALGVLAEYAAPLLRIGGSLVAWKGHVDESETADAVHACERLNLSAPAGRRVKPYAGSERRTLYLVEKVGLTPSEFPRRPGWATKKPLRANGKPRVEP